MNRLLLGLCLLACVTNPAGATPTLITPDAGQTGGGDILPFNPNYYGFGFITLQQITLSNQFSVLGGPALLTGLDFVNYGGGVVGSMPGATLSIGVTPVTPSEISSNLAANEGSGGVTPVADNYTLQSIAGTYDVHLSLDTPFLYDPSAGNLLLQYFTPGTASGPFIMYSTSTVAGGAFSAANRGVFAQNTEDRLTQYEFQSVAAPELEVGAAGNAVVLAFGMLMIASSRRKLIR